MHEKMMLTKALKEKLPQLRVCVVEAEIPVEPTRASLKAFILERYQQISKEVTSDALAKLPAIKWGRSAYRVLGKDPTRYRLSSEKLYRRLIKGDGIAFINNVVDLSNWLSVELNACISALDGAKLRQPLLVDFGRSGEAYHCLAHYELNLEGLPIIRSNQQPVGSTTSDSLETSISDSTRHVVLVAFIFDPEEDCKEIITMMTSILRTHASATILMQYSL